MLIRFENEVYDLEIAGIRRLLHQDVNEFAYRFELEYEDEEDLNEVHELISAQDVEALLDGFFLGGDLYFISVESDDLLQKALEEAGYKAEKSFASRSLYVINDNGEEVRISDHKRPAIEQNGIYEDHEYDNEIIIEGNVVTLHELHASGLSKLNKAEYILG